MSVKVIGVKHDGTKGTVICESDLTDWPKAIMELREASTQNLALTAAAKEGLPDPRCELRAAPYAIDADNEVITKPKEQVIAAYRLDVPVTRKLV